MGDLVIIGLDIPLLAIVIQCWRIGKRGLINSILAIFSTSLLVGSVICMVIDFSEIAEVFSVFGSIFTLILMILTFLEDKYMITQRK